MEARSGKTTVAVIFGGRSGEHEVSLRSARSVIAGFDISRYDVIPLKIEKDGKWVFDPAYLPVGHRAPGESGVRVLAPMPHDRPTLLYADGTPAERFDVAFPLVHGTGGEDGTLQGLFELADIPYCGSGVLGSAVGMDKAVQKTLLKAAGLPVAAHVAFVRQEWEADPDGTADTAEAMLGYPIFVKPANLGSSVGITKAHHRRELIEGIRSAFAFDTKVIAEQAVPNARELECAVLGNEDPDVAGTIGEIIPSNEFYDYDAKYVDDRSVTVIPAPLPPRTADTLRRMAAETYRTLDAKGYARVDFLVARDTNEIYVNEINTLPGFTSISMFPKLWEASGVPFPELLDRIVAHSLKEADAKRQLVRDFAKVKKGKLA